MEFAALLFDFVARMSWPVVALILGRMILKELNSGLVAKIVQPGGSIEYGSVKLTVSELDEAKAKVESVVGSVEETPEYAEKSISTNIQFEENFSPYEIVMTSWGDLANSITSLANSHDGYNDRRQIWSNIEILREKGVIDPNTEAAVRSIQIVRNGIRRTQRVTESEAKKFAQSAFALKIHFDKLQQSR